MASWKWHPTHSRTLWLLGLLERRIYANREIPPVVFGFAHFWFTILSLEIPTPAALRPIVGAPNPAPGIRPKTAAGVWALGKPPPK